MKSLTGISIMLIILFFGCNVQQSDSGQTPKATAFKNVLSDEAKQLLAEDRDIIIIDVRTPQEFNMGHLKGAKNINISDRNFRSKIEGLEKDSTYLIYCRTGNRSRHAIELMKELNFTSVYHLEHGITEWVGEGNSLEK